MVEPTCDYSGCDAACELERYPVGSDTCYCYCPEHDPLDDEAVADHWTATMDGGPP